MYGMRFKIYVQKGRGRGKPSIIKEVTPVYSHISYSGCTHSQVVISTREIFHSDSWSLADYAMDRSRIYCTSCNNLILIFRASIKLLIISYFIVISFVHVN